MRRARILLEGRVVDCVLEGGELVTGDGARIDPASAEFRCPVSPSKIAATHLSYRSRCEEYAMERPPATPSYFLKPPSSLSWHGADVVRPAGCEYLNYEGEIAVVIGRRCRGSSVADALSYVGGYTVADDWGVHDFRHADRGSMLRVKGQDGFCPLGPYVVDAADVDPEALTVRTYVDGELAQEGDTAEDLIFSFAYQIADLSRLITLEPGDVILTGTPANSRPVEPGSVVEVEVEGIGRLANSVVGSDERLEQVGEAPEVSAATLHVALAMPEDEAERRAAAGERPKER